MTLVKSDIPQLLTLGLKTQFFNTFQTVPTTYDKICTVIPSDQDTEQYGWLGALPGVREFLDERALQELAPYAYAIKNKTWESTIGIERAALEDDRYGEIVMRIKQMAQSARQHMDILTYGLLSRGFTAPCYDGTPFFGTHPLSPLAGVVTPSGAATQTNKGTDALTAASLQNAITAMMRYVDDQGKPAGVMPDCLIVPPELWWEARVLMESAYYPDLVSVANQDLAANTLKGLLTIVCSPYLPRPNDWFLCDSKRVVRAIILQMRKDFEFQALEGTSENGFMRDQWLYGVRARYNAGFGDWRAAYGSLVG